MSTSKIDFSYELYRR